MPASAQDFKSGSISKTMRPMLYVFLGFFRMHTPVECLQDRNQESIIHNANFITDHFQYLSASRIISFLVRSPYDCPFRCIEELRCSSLNVAAYPDSSGGYLCELLDTHKYKAGNKLLMNTTFHHYGPWTLCSTSPCLNNGDCIPDFTMNYYQCDCKPGYQGVHCEACSNFNFENGILGWEKTGTAFNNQPTYGDNPTARAADTASQEGNWWIGGYEDRPSKAATAGRVQGDAPQGTLTSPSFRITGKKISFLIGGGCDIITIRAELVIAEKAVRNATGVCSETMTRKLWDVEAFIGQRARVKLLDFKSGQWGHINFDDLKGDISCG